MAEEIKENVVVEDNSTQTNTNVDTKVDEKGKNDSSNLSIEEQLQQLRIENIKLKKATDKATSEASNYKKQLRAKQSEDEIALQEKAEREAEREERFKSMERELNINRLEKNFVMLGYNEQQAHDSAVAQIDGDTDSLFKIQSEVQASIIKQKESEWLASRPPVQAGGGDNDKPDPFLLGFGR